jgi:hypothetical protein
MVFVICVLAFLGGYVFAMVLDWAGVPAWLIVPVGLIMGFLGGWFMNRRDR